MLVTVDWLYEHMNDLSVRVIDCRFDLANENEGKDSYEKGHIPSALYFDLNKDLSSPVTKHGGRHPLPDVEQLSEKLSKAGIDENVTVVAYDSQGGAMASRLWWLLTYLGHERVYVLNGGFPAWKERGFPVTDAIASFNRAVFKPSVQHGLLVSMDELKAKVTRQEDMTLIDSREEKRYAGVEEPVDPIAGHIPSAKNDFWKNGLTEEGYFKEKEAQIERFASLPKGKEIIVYCGSGVTACPNVLALKMAGFEDVKLYAGSWSDWISYAENEIEKEAK